MSLDETVITAKYGPNYFELSPRAEGNALHVRRIAGGGVDVIILDACGGEHNVVVSLDELISSLQWLQG